MTRLAVILAMLALGACGPLPTEPPPGEAAAPSTIRIVWADGQTDYPGFCEGTVPTWFRCDNGADCKPSILAGIAAWLAPFNVDVTDHDGPAPLVTALMSSGLAPECGQPAGLRGRAVLGAPAAGSWINVWSAGNDDRADAQTVAHEIGHAVGGLRHVAEGSVMQQNETPVDVGYDDVWRGNETGEQQNAFEAMMSTLGAR